MKNSDYVRGAYDEIHAPDALFGKVMNMNKKENATRNKLKYAVAALGIFAITLAASNGICYAATGESWVNKAFVYINGEIQEYYITCIKKGDVISGELQLDVNEQDDVVVSVVDAVNTSTTSDTMTSEETARLKTENGKVYLLIAGESIDITDDFADGEATAQIDLNGQIITYTVTGTPDIYDISLKSNQ